MRRPLRVLLVGAGRAGMDPDTSWRNLLAAAYAVRALEAVVAPHRAMGSGRLVAVAGVRG